MTRSCAWLLVLCMFCPPAVAQEPVSAELQQYTEQMMQQAQIEAAADDKVGGKWRGVPRIKGVATIFSRATIEEAERMPSVVSRRDDYVTVRFELVRDDTHGSAGLLWRAREVSLASGISTQESYRDGGTVMSMTEDGQFRGAAEHPEEITLDLNTQSGRWQILTPGHTAEKYTVTRRWNGQQFELGQWAAVNETDIEDDNRVQGMNFNGTIADQPGITIGTVLIDDTPADQPTRPGQRRGRIEFWPEYDDYTLEVRIDDYANWRPLGQVAQPGKPGSNLTAKATVLPKGDASPPLVRAISFQLLDVSREPGVCLNWPLGAKRPRPRPQAGGASG